MCKEKADSRSNPTTSTFPPIYIGFFGYFAFASYLKTISACP